MFNCWKFGVAVRNAQSDRAVLENIRIRKGHDQFPKGHHRKLLRPQNTIFTLKELNPTPYQTRPFVKEFQKKVSGIQ